MDHEELRIREKPHLGIHIPNLTERRVNSMEDLTKMLNLTNQNALIVQTRMSAVISRVSYLYQIVLENIPNRASGLPTMINVAITAGLTEIHSLLSSLTLRIRKAKKGRMQWISSPRWISDWFLTQCIYECLVRIIEPSTSTTTCSISRLQINSTSHRLNDLW